MESGLCGCLGQPVPCRVDLGSGPEVEPVETPPHSLEVLTVLGHPLRLEPATPKHVQVNNLPNKTYRVFQINRDHFQTPITQKV